MDLSKIATKAFSGKKPKKKEAFAGLKYLLGRVDTSDRDMEEVAQELYAYFLPKVSSRPTSDPVEWVKKAIHEDALRPDLTSYRRIPAPEEGVTHVVALSRERLHMFTKAGVAEYAVLDRGDTQIPNPGTSFNYRGAFPKEEAYTLKAGDVDLQPGEDEGRVFFDVIESSNGRVLGRYKQTYWRDALSLISEEEPTFSFYANRAIVVIRMGAATAVIAGMRR